jgi:hypothetical protein
MSMKKGQFTLPATPLQLGSNSSFRVVTLWILEEDPCDLHRKIIATARHAISSHLVTKQVSGVFRHRRIQPIVLRPLNCISTFSSNVVMMCRAREYKLTSLAPI